MKKLESQVIHITEERNRDIRELNEEKKVTSFSCLSVYNHRSIFFGPVSMNFSSQPIISAHSYRNDSFLWCLPDYPRMHSTQGDHFNNILVY